jgi:formiminoglutamase
MEDRVQRPLDSAIKNIALFNTIVFCKGSQLIVLGQVNVCEEMKEVEHDFNDVDDRSKLSQLVDRNRQRFHHFTIIKAGKNLYIGGHNNFMKHKGAVLGGNR